MMTNSSTATVQTLPPIDIPTDYRVAMTDPNWKKAMDDEMTAFHRNKKWELADLPAGN